MEAPLVPDIVGTPIKIDNLEVAQYNLPNRMNWDDAKIACAKLGEGWRLPTKNELNLLYQNKDKIGGFANYGYWSSTEYNKRDAWGKEFSKGFQGYDSYYHAKYFRCFVRAVRNF